jgi:hypothetical protein
VLGAGAVSGSCAVAVAQVPVLVALASGSAKEVTPPGTWLGTRNLGFLNSAQEGDSSYLSLFWLSHAKYWTRGLAVRKAVLFLDDHAVPTSSISVGVDCIPRAATMINLECASSHETIDGRISRASDGTGNTVKRERCRPGRC